VGGGFSPGRASSFSSRARLTPVAGESRREDFASTGHDREQEHRARIGFRRDGAIAAIDDIFFADVGAYPAQGNGLTLNTVNHLPGPYRVPHYRSVGTSVVTNKTLNMAYRAAGRPEAVFVMERLMDIGARCPASTPQRSAAGTRH
jgi:carbon-monoxide dehydrogenase large subunit